MSGNASPPPTQGVESTEYGPGPPTPDEIRDRLGAVVDPAFGEDVVSLGLVGNIDVTERLITIELALFAPYAPSERLIVDRIHEAFAGHGRKVITVIADDAGRSVPTEGIAPGNCAAIDGVRNVVAVDGAAASDRHPEATLETAVELSRLGAEVGAFVLDDEADCSVAAAPGRTDGVRRSDGPIDPPTVRGVRVGRGDDLRRASESITWREVDYLLVDVTAASRSSRSEALDRLAGAPGLVTAAPTSPASVVQASHDAFRERGVTSVGTLELEDASDRPEPEGSANAAGRRGIVRPVGFQAEDATALAHDSIAAAIADRVGAVRRRAVNPRA